MKAEEFARVRRTALSAMRQKNLPTHLHDEAEGEVFLRALIKHGQADEDTVKSVVWGVARDLYWDSFSPLTGVGAITKYRDVKNDRLTTRTVSLSISQGALDFVESKVLSDEKCGERDGSVVRDALNVLSTKERDVVSMLYYEPAQQYSFGRPPDNRTENGLTASETARRIGITEAAVRYRHNQALKKLRKELEHRGYGVGIEE